MYAGPDPYIVMFDEIDRCELFSNDVVVNADAHADLALEVGAVRLLAGQVEAVDDQPRLARLAALPAEPRFWTGICNHMQLVATEPDGLSTYQVSIVPALWLATQRRNYRMFQQLSELGPIAVGRFKEASPGASEALALTDTVAAMIRVEPLGSLPYVEHDGATSSQERLIFHLPLEHFAESSRLGRSYLVGEHTRDVTFYLALGEAVADRDPTLAADADATGDPRLAIEARLALASALRGQAGLTLADEALTRLGALPPDETRDLAYRLFSLRLELLWEGRLGDLAADPQLAPRPHPRHPQHAVHGAAAQQVTLGVGEEQPLAGGIGPTDAQGVLGAQAGVAGGDGRLRGRARRLQLAGRHHLLADALRALAGAPLGEQGLIVDVRHFDM